MKRLNSWAAIGGLLLALVGLTGCTTMKSALSKRDDQAMEQRPRKTETTQTFERQRDSAEFEAAQALWGEGRREECRRRLLAILDREPEHLDARLLLADVLLAEHRVQEALQVLQPALQTHPNDARVQYGVALLLDALGQRQGAEAHYEQAVRLEPDNEVYQVSYQQVIAAGVPSEAAFLPPVPSEDTARAERMDYAEPVDTEVPATASLNDFLQQGQQALTRGDAQAGLACFQRAMAERPDDPQIPISAAIAALRSNHPDVAIAVLEPAVRQFPRSAALQRILGTAYYRRGGYRSSQLALQQALSLDKSNALSYFLLGCTQVKLGESEAARRCFRQAQLLDPRYAVRR